MEFVLCKIIFILGTEFVVVKGVKFSAESFSEISLLAKEGKYHLETLTEKANFPQYGFCWKNAISDLQIGCKFLSENIQSDLALKFTDCFLQMSGHEPLTCDLPKSLCLQKLTDRAFNAYTEFYTHTQSICYFLQSQIWHEEAEKTIDKLSSTSRIVSKKLEEAEKTQEKLLNQQKESLFLQRDLIDNSKNVALTLQTSQDRINNIMKDFQSAASKQQEMLIEVLENILSLKSWAVNEISWFSSTIFFIAATIIGFLFSSVPRTRGARIFIFLIFGLNYLFERILISSSLTDASIRDVNLTTEAINSWIWWCRKFCVSLSFIVTLYVAFNYYDYNILNYQLLLEIRKLNHQILQQYNNLESNKYYNYRVRFSNEFDDNKNNFEKNRISLNSVSKVNKLNFNESLSYSPNVTNIHLSYSPDTVDHTDDHNSTVDNSVNVSITSEKNITVKEARSYNLRSSKLLKY